MRLSVLDAQREARNRETTLRDGQGATAGRHGPRYAAPHARACGEPGGSSPPRPLQAAEAMALAEQNRPDIISLRRQIAKARSGITVERTKAYPCVAPSAGMPIPVSDRNWRARTPRRIRSP